MNDREELDREVMERAIRRLNILEYVILGAAALLALVGGALVAWLLGEVAEVPFRISWLVASLLLFVVPGGIVYARERLSTAGREAVEQGEDMETTTGEVDG